MAAVRRVRATALREDFPRQALTCRLLVVVAGTQSQR
jgi:hypothetical protein